MLLLHLRQELGQHRHHHGLAHQALEDIEVITVIAIGIRLIVIEAHQALEDREVISAIVIGSSGGSSSTGQDRTLIGRGTGAPHTQKGVSCV